MFELFALLIMIIDGMVIGFIVALLCRLLLGDTPFARLIRLLLSIAAGVGYFLLCIHIGWGETNISLGEGTFVFLFPIGILTILKVVEYMYKDK